MKEKKRVFTVGYYFDGRTHLRVNQELYICDGILEHSIPANDASPFSQEIRRAYSGAAKIEKKNGLLLPGLINAHHHAYSALARGMPIRGDLANFENILSNLWWRLDKALDRAAVSVSAAVTAMDSLRHGCTSIIDHHSSPSFVEGSLDTIASVFKKMSMTGLLCFETSDRNGEEILEESIAENLSFAENRANDAQVRGLFGLHAGFTLCEGSLRAVGKRKPDELPIHAHVAEDMVDRRFAEDLGYLGALDRLDKFGLLATGSLIGHAIHLADGELPLVEKRELRVAHNPQSNSNNGVGYCDPSRFKNEAPVLGTDGMNSDMLSSAQFAYLEYCASGKGAISATDLVDNVLFKNPAAYLSKFFHRPVGTVEEGYPADFAIFDYPSPTPLHEDNLLGHIVYGLPHHSTARYVYANGQPVIEDGELIVTDEEEILQEARECSNRLWKKYLEMSK